MKLTLSVRSFHTPAPPGTCAWPPSLPSVPTSRAARIANRRVLDLALLADTLAQAAQLAFQALVGLDDVVDRARHLAGLSCRCDRHAYGEIPAFDRGENPQHHPGIGVVSG